MGGAMGRQEDPGVPLDVEGVGYGFRVVRKISGDAGRIARALCHAAFALKRITARVLALRATLLFSVGVAFAGPCVGATLAFTVQAAIALGGGFPRSFVDLRFG